MREHRVATSRYSRQRSAHTAAYLGFGQGTRVSLARRQPARFESAEVHQCKRECKEPSNLPFKQILTGSSPVAFTTSNVNAKRLEQIASQAMPIEFNSRHVHQPMPHWRNRQTRRLERLVSKDVPVRFWREAPITRCCRNWHTYCVQTAGFLGSTPRWRTNQSEMRSGCSQVVKAERCDRSIHGFESHQSPHISFSRRGREARRAAATRFTAVQIYSTCPIYLGVGQRLTTWLGTRTHAGSSPATQTSICSLAQRQCGRPITD